MKLKATVTFNDDAVPVSFRVTQAATDGHTVTFGMCGSTAVAKRVDVPSGEDCAYLGEVNDILEYAETLPFVQTSRMKGGSGIDE